MPECLLCPGFLFDLLGLPKSDRGHIQCKLAVNLSEPIVYQPLRCDVGCILKMALENFD
jgi:hypothetical protein